MLKNNKKYNKSISELNKNREEGGPLHEAVEKGVDWLVVLSTTHFDRKLETQTDGDGIQILSVDCEVTFWQQEGDTDQTTVYVLFDWIGWTVVIRLTIH